MRTLTAVLVLRSSCSSVGCRIVHPVMHKVLHFTAVAATSLAPTETVRSTAAAYTAATSAEASAVGFLNSDCGSGKQLHTHLGVAHHASGRTVPQSTSSMPYPHLHRHQLRMLKHHSTWQLSSRLLLPSKRCSSALCKCAAAHLLNTAGMTRLPKQIVCCHIRCHRAARSSTVAYLRRPPAAAALPQAWLVILASRRCHQPAHAIRANSDISKLLQGHSFGCTACANQRRPTASKGFSKLRDHAF
jgi:hypothetical protein